MIETTTASAPSRTRPLLIVAGLGGMMVAGTLVLWAHYGTTVFYEMIAAGLAACF